MKTMLFVEPDKNLQQLLSEYFTDLGNKVFISQDKNTTVDKLKHNQIDVVVYEYINVDGIEIVLDMVNRMVPKPKTVLLTVNSTQLKQMIDRFKPDIAIRKPFNLDDLEKAILE